MLVMIGRSWVTAAGDQGRRLDQADDFVRIEVAAALARKDVRVIPVLVDGARMPTAEELPENIRNLSRRHAFEISERHWDFDVDLLTNALAKNTGITEKPTPSSKKSRFAVIAASTISGRTTWAVLGAVLLAVIGGAYIVIIRPWTVPPISSPMPDPSASAFYGDYTISAVGESYEIEIVAGGELDASVLGIECVGQIATAPDVHLDFESSGAPLSFRVLSDFDSTLVINSATGDWLCDDDSAGDLNALVVIENPDYGAYDVWIGDYGESEIRSISQHTNTASLTISHITAP